MAQRWSGERGPGSAALAVLGTGVLLAVVVGLIYGAATGNMARGFGQAFAVVVTLAAIAGVVAAYQSDAQRKRSAR